MHCFPPFYGLSVWIGLFSLILWTDCGHGETEFLLAIDVVFVCLFLKQGIMSSVPLVVLFFVIILVLFLH